MRKILSLLFVIALPFITNAHTYWITTEGSHKVNEPVTVKIFFGEYATGELMSGKALDKMKDIKMIIRYTGAADQVLEMTQDTGYWKGSFTPKAEGTYEIIGLNDIRDVQDWTKHGFGIVRPIQYLKHQYQVGSTKSRLSTTALLDINISNTSPGIYNITLYKNNKPAANTKFFISTPDGEEKQYETDTNGNLQYTATVPGLQIAGIEWVDKTPGQFKGKDYGSIRHRLDASFYYNK